MGVRGIVSLKQVAVLTHRLIARTNTPSPPCVISLSRKWLSFEPGSTSTQADFHRSTGSPSTDFGCVVAVDRRCMVSNEKAHFFPCRQLARALHSPLIKHNSHSTCWPDCGHYLTSALSFRPASEQAPEVMMVASRITPGQRREAMIHGWRETVRVLDASSASLCPVVRSYFVSQAQLVPSDGSALPVSSATFAALFRHGGITRPNERS